MRDDSFLRNYLHGQQMVADLTELLGAPSTAMPIFPGTSLSAGRVTMTSEGAWSCVSVGDIRAYFRPARKAEDVAPAGLRYFVISDLCESVRELRLRTGSRASLGFLCPALHLPRVRLFDSALWGWRETPDAIPADGDMIPEADLPISTAYVLRAADAVRSRHA